jgi:transposase
MPKQVFKPYDQNQMYILPPSLEELIAKNHPVRIVNEVIEKIDIEPLLREYKGGGTSSYNPKMLLKVMVYSYLRNVYSSRKIEEMIKENIHMMWISGMNKPDHHTINRFRSERLKKVLEEIFGQIVELLIEAGQLSIKEIYIDGTKIEANANKYTFVWGKAVTKNKERISQQLQELWEYSQRIAKEEEKEEEKENFEEIDPEKIEERIKKIDKALKDKPVSKKVKQKLRYAKKNWSKNLKKYEEQEKKLGDRNSYSKTDEGATFMRMKEDHMLNGQLKAGYNIQISSSNQYIVNYSLHQKPTDTTTLPGHIESYKEKYGTVPEVIVADGGYGSEENYEYLENQKIEGYVKYNYYDKEQKKSKKDKKPFAAEKLYYNKEEDCYYCPMGQKMNKIGEGKRKSENGYLRTVSQYQAINCNGCPVRGVCHNQKGSRIISVSHRGNELRKKAKEKLETEEGIKYRKKRPVEAEPVFGNIKQNKKFKRFYLRGLQKVKTEFGLIAIAHNLGKLAAAT